MSDILYIYGTGGHSKVLYDIANLNAYPTIIFLDDSPKKEFLGCEVKSLKDLKGDEKIIVAIGDNYIRGQVINKLLLTHATIEFVSLIHPQSIIAKDVKIGCGSVIMAGAIINSGTTIGNHCIVNTKSSIDHDCNIANFASIAPGCTLGGNVSIGSLSAIGIGASIKHSIKIGKSCVIGGGSYVHNDIIDNCVAYGVPCKPVRMRKVEEKYL